MINENSHVLIITRIKIKEITFSDKYNNCLIRDTSLLVAIV